MVRIFLGCCLITVFSSNISAQVTFQRSYGTVGIDWTYAMLADQTADGGYGLCSYTSYTGADSAVYFIRLDSAGAVMWSKKYNDGWTDPFAMHATSDGGFIIAGATNDSLSSIGAYLLKIDSTGNILWSRAYGGPAMEQAFAVKETSDGGFIVAGESNSYDSTGNLELYLLKTSAYGNREWSRVIGGAGSVEGFTVTETSDGGFVAAGSTSIAPGGGYMVKTDSLGALFWTRMITVGGGATIYSIEECADHSLAMATTSTSGITLIKTDSGGNFLWGKGYTGGAGPGLGYCVTQTADGGYALAGFSYQQTSYVLIKTDSAGNDQWYKEFSSAGNFPSATQPFVMGQSMDGGYFISGSTTGTNGDLLLIKTNQQGISGCNEIVMPCITTIVTPTITSSGTPGPAPGQFFGHTIMSVIPTTTNTFCGVPIGIEEEQPTELLLLYPNPSTGKFRLSNENPGGELWICNALGDVIYYSENAGGNTEIDLSSEPDGMYFVRMKTAGEYFTQKLTIQK